MTYASPHIINRLCSHAGLPPVTEGDDLAKFLWDLHQSRYDSLDVRRLASLVGEIIGILQTLYDDTHHMRSTKIPRDRLIPEPLAYAMSGIIDSLLTSTLEGRHLGTDERLTNLLTEAVANISFCWDAFLAGDISDLRRELYWDMFARGFGDSLGLFAGEENKGDKCAPA